jgi:hypothetical protein
MFMRGREYWPDGLPGYAGRDTSPAATAHRYARHSASASPAGRIAPQMERIAPPSTGIMAPVM